MPDDANGAEHAGPRSALRVMDILLAVATEPEGLSLAKISDRLRLPKTSVFSLLRALEGGGYLRNHDGRYTLGDQALKLGASLGQARSFPKCARPAPEWLARETEETILLGVLSEEGHEISYFAIASRLAFEAKAFRMVEVNFDQVQVSDPLIMQDLFDGFGAGGLRKVTGTSN
jgi:hypothetical protein